MASRDFQVRYGAIVNTALQVNNSFYANSSLVLANTTFIANGNITANGNIVANSNLQANSLQISAALFANSTLVYANTGVTANGNVNAVTLNANNISANTISLTSNPAIDFIMVGNTLGNAYINSSGFYFNGTPFSGGGGVIGTTTQVAFNDAGTMTGSANLIFTKATGAPTTQAYNSSKQVLPFATTINWNASNGVVASITLTANTTFAAPTNIGVSSYILLVAQDATGSRKITWNSVFKWPGKVAPTLTTTAFALDVFSFVSDGTNMYGSYMNNVG